MLIDYSKIYVKAGNGGDGCMSFRRELYVANGGPDGGDGGRGASVYLKVDSNLNTLLDFKYKKKFIGENGKMGEGAKCTGKSATDLYIPVPQGTIVRDIDNNKIIADLTNDGDELLLVKGGKGGKGNQHFATSTRQVPMFAEMGEKGKERNIELELKMLADVGLIGFPNVGKSTIISKVSSAKPKIANYHFTTLNPSLGVVKVNDSTFVMADIPGIIEGASEGIGLGIKFLRHIERTRILLHVVDVSGSEGRVPLEDYNLINKELVNYSEKLSKKIQIVVANKMDSLFDENMLKDLEKECVKNKVKLFKISAVTGDGLNDLMIHISKELEKIPKEDIIQIDYDIDEDTQVDQTWNIEIIKDGFKVTGAPIERLMMKVNIYDVESRQYMQRILTKLGVMKKLREMGLKNGDILIINDYHIEFYE